MIVTRSLSSKPSPFAVLVHGGAGSVPEAARPRHASGCMHAAREAGGILARGGSALDAVERAVSILEDDPSFNAGHGACLDEDGHLSLDAAIMDGALLRAGGVCALPAFKNPVAIARRLLERDHAVLLAGEGALRFALREGFHRADEATMITDASRAKWEEARRAGTTPGDAGGTVGAVARDRTGHLAAATSTGGRVAKPLGRVGDSPVPGAGTYADDGAGACSGTGDGEAFLRLCLSKTAIEWLRAGVPPEEAARATLELLASRTGAHGGLLLVTPDGRVALARSTLTMGFALVGEGFEESGT